MGKKKVENSVFHLSSSEGHRFDDSHNSDLPGGGVIA